MKRSDDAIVILQIEKNIPFTYEGRLAFSLSATLGDKHVKNEALKWIYCDFTQEVCNKEIIGRMRHDFFHIYHPNNPFIIRKYALRLKRMWTNPDKALNDVINNISKGYFVHIRLDLSKIGSFGMKDRKFVHSEHIYGFDKTKELLFLMRFDYKKGVELKTISFEEFKNAYIPLLGEKQKLINVYDKVRYKKYRIRKKRLYRRIVDYGKSRFSILDFLLTQFKTIIFAWDVPYGKAVGISVIDYIKKILELEIKLQKNGELKYGRYFRSRTRLQAIWEFRRLMYERLNFMMDNGMLALGEETRSLLDEYKKLTNDYLIIRNQYIKYQISENIDILKNIIKRLEVLAEREKELINLLSVFFVK